MSLQQDTGFFGRLRHQYRLVVMNDNTFEERFSFQLSRLNVYIFLSTLLVVTVAIVLLAIIYTPLKEYIPGYGDTDLRKQVLHMSYKTDSLEQMVQLQEVYLRNIRNVLVDSLETEGIDTGNQVVANVPMTDSIALDSLSDEETKLREDIEQSADYQLFGGLRGGERDTRIEDIHFFTPLKGYLIDGFDVHKEHFGVDIVAPENEVIKSVANGRVILASWTLETGYVLGIQHEGNLVSFYKHNSVLLKEVGNTVKAGDVVAIIGSSGEKSTGPHLHFELWYKENPIDPAEYIDFE